MQRLIDPQGIVRCIYDELIPLAALGAVVIRRASHVEPSSDGWYADLSPVQGPKLGPFALRSAALQAESDWLERHLQDVQLS